MECSENRGFFKCFCDFLFFDITINFLKKLNFFKKFSSIFGAYKQHKSKKSVVPLYFVLILSKNVNFEKKDKFSFGGWFQNAPHWSGALVVEVVVDVSCAVVASFVDVVVVTFFVVVLVLNNFFKF